MISYTKYDDWILLIRFVEMAKLDYREPIINTPWHLSRHPTGICEEERFGLEVCRKQVRRYNTTRLRGSTQLSGSTQSLGQSK
jgi:hypothetical protein